MDYNEYRNEYQKIILKESLKRGISVKQRLMETIRNSDKQEMLEQMTLMDKSSLTN